MVYIQQKYTFSVDFDEIKKLQRHGLWDKISITLSKAAKIVESSGADFLLLYTNTFHKVAPEIEAAISIPFLHIADETGEKLILDKVKCVGLLGTKFTMEQDFYKKRLTNKFKIDVIVPDIKQRKVVHDIICSELCLGKLNHESKQQYFKIINCLHHQGAEEIILGCTETSLLIQQVHTKIPLYNTYRNSCNKSSKTGNIIRR